MSGKQPFAYLDLELEIEPGHGRQYPVSVLSSPAGEARGTLRLPFDDLKLENYLLALQNALLRSGGKRRQLALPEEQAVIDFGGALFNALFDDEIRSSYDVSLREAARQGKGLRLKLRILAPELASLPWEYLFDVRQDHFLSLSRTTPIVRYLELRQSVEPLAVTPPLRILGMVASPADLDPLDIATEQQRVERAIQNLRHRGLVELTWLAGQGWRDLQRAMRDGPWHIFHFVGHGGFDEQTQEGLIAVTDERGAAYRLPASALAQLLADHTALRLVVLNSCDGARGSNRDVFSSTAAILVQRGIPSVLAMQFAITDSAAIEFSQSFYEGLADSLPVDAAVAEARKSISLAVANSMEWGTPVLFMRATDGQVFDIKPAEHATSAAAAHTHVTAPTRALGSDGGTTTPQAPAVSKTAGEAWAPTPAQVGALDEPSFPTLAPPAQPINGTNVSNTPGRSDESAIAFDAAGALHIFWLDTTPRQGTAETILHRALAADGTWSQVEDWTPGVEYVGRPELVRNHAGKLCLVAAGVVHLYSRWNQDGRWSALAGPGVLSTHNVFSPALDSRGQLRWLTGLNEVMFGDVKLDDGLSGVCCARLAIDTNNGYHAVWHRAGNPYSIEYRFSPDAGRNWQPAQRLSAPNAEFAEHPALAADGAGGVHVVWQESGKLVYRQWTGADGWSAPVEAVNRGGIGAPRLTIDPRNLAHVVWSSGYEQYYAQQLPDRSWRSPRVIAVRQDHLGSGPHVAVDADGVRHFTWQDSGNDGARDVFYGLLPPE